MTIKELRDELDTYPSLAKVLVWDTEKKDYRPLVRGELAAVYFLGSERERE